MTQVYFKLSEHCEVFPGFPFESAKFSRRSEDVSLVKGENLHQGFIDWDNAKKWPTTDWDYYQKYQLYAGDIVLAMDRPWIEAGLKWSSISKRSPKALLVQRVARLRSRGNLCQSYLRHIIGSSVFESYIKTIITGVNVPHISGKDIGNFRLPLPPLPIQRKIAAVLSAYDDLIENNTRRIAILEKMAEELYREWFVRLRFPGHEKTKIVKGVPEGWKQIELIEIASINQRTIGKGFAHEWIDYLDISAVSTNSISKPDRMKLSESPSRARRLVKHGDIIWSTVRPANRAFALVLNPQENLVVSTGFAVLTPRENIPFSFLHRISTTNEFVDQMVSVAKGAAYPATSSEDFGKAKVWVPPQKLLEIFAKICDTLYLKAHFLCKKRAILSAARDGLLPRLMSGKINLEPLDIHFPPSMREEELVHA